VKVSKSLEGPDGSVTFEGEISPSELELIISVGLNYLMSQGALPFKVAPAKDIAHFVPGNEETH
jgi:hypothetical protein